MNLSVFLVGIAHRAASLARRYGERDPRCAETIWTAVVFAWLAIEALLNEQAYAEIHFIGGVSKREYDKAESTAGSVERVQTILASLYGKKLKAGTQPAQDLKLLSTVRNSLVHYNFRDPRVLRVLDELERRGYVRRAGREPWASQPITWAMYVTPALAEWALSTACATADAITALMPTDGAHKADVEMIRANFAKRPLDDGGTIVARART